MSARRLARPYAYYQQQRWDRSRLSWRTLADRVGTVVLLTLTGLLLAAVIGVLIFGLMEGLHAWVVWRRGV